MLALLKLKQTEFIHIERKVRDLLKKHLKPLEGKGSGSTTGKTSELYGEGDSPHFSFRIL